MYNILRCIDYYEYLRLLKVYKTVYLSMFNVFLLSFNKDREIDFFFNLHFFFKFIFR